MEPFGVVFLLFSFEGLLTTVGLHLPKEFFYRVMWMRVTELTKRVNNPRSPILATLRVRTFSQGTKNLAFQNSRKFLLLKKPNIFLLSCLGIVTLKLL
jgi:hypothetical protein